MLARVTEVVGPMLHGPCDPTGISVMAVGALTLVVAALAQMLALALPAPLLTKDQLLLKRSAAASRARSPWHSRARCCWCWRVLLM